MKRFRYLLILFVISSTISSCSLWNKAFPPKYGCGSDGKNVGAEKLLNDDGKQKKAPKFKA